MARRRRRRKMIKKFILCISSPIVTAFLVKTAPKAADYLDKADKLMLSGKENVIKQNTTDILQYNNIEYTEDFEDMINSDYIVSNGYGYLEETDDNALAVYETISDNPGAKPYPTEWTKGAAIMRTTYGKFTGKTFFKLEKAGQVNNQTSVLSATLSNESKKLPEFKISFNSNEPQVLIYHTHTTESFEPYVRDYSDPTFNYRTTDETKNIVMVGGAIAQQLENAGIAVIHDTTIHDYPSYNGSYDRSRETIKRILEQYPSIKIILDVHRDAISSAEATYQPIVEIDGKEAAQVMIISGCDDGTMNMPNYMQNFRLASLLQQQIESDYSGLTRPILFDYRKYNQNMSTGALLFEIGSHGNTLEQVHYSGELVGKSIAKALMTIKE